MCVQIAYCTHFISFHIYIYGLIIRPILVSLTTAGACGRAGVGAGEPLAANDGCAHPPVDTTDVGQGQEPPHDPGPSGGPIGHNQGIGGAVPPDGSDQKELGANNEGDSDCAATRRGRQADRPDLDRFEGSTFG